MPQAVSFAWLNTDGKAPPKIVASIFLAEFSIPQNLARNLAKVSQGLAVWTPGAERKEFFPTLTPT